MTIYLEANINDSKLAAKRIASYIEYTDLISMTHFTQIIYDPDCNSVDDKVGKPWFIKGDDSLLNVPWMLRVCLDRAQLVQRDVVLMDLKTKLVEFWSSQGVSTQLKRSDKILIEKVSNLAVQITSDVDNHPCMHVRYNMAHYCKQDMLDFRDFVLRNVRQKGIEGIKSISDISGQIQCWFCQVMCIWVHLLQQRI